MPLSSGLNWEWGHPAVQSIHHRRVDGADWLSETAVVAQRLILPRDR